MSSFATALAAELVVVLAIFIGAATYVNFDAIGHAIQSWAGVW
jgi:hypothetical protein